MEEIRMPCIVWFPGDPAPDVSGFSDPIRVPFTFRSYTDAAAPGADGNGPTAPAQGGPPGRVELVGSTDHPVQTVCLYDDGSKRAPVIIDNGPDPPIS